MRRIISVLMATCCIAGTAAPQTPKFKAYSDVITADAKSQQGVFNVHKVDEKVYFEIPSQVLGREMMWQGQERSIPVRLGSPGFEGSKLVRWDRRGGQIFLVGINPTFRSMESGPTALGVRNIGLDAILESFKVEAESPSGGVVIDVSEFLVSDPTDLNIGKSWNASVQRAKSYVQKVKAFPKNVEIESLLTFRIPAPIDTLPGTDSGYAPQTGPNASVLMHYSFLMLPEKPMMPRYRDPRIGYFGLRVQEYGGAENRAINREIIRRYRLEKKDPTAAVSEPIEPITFYINRDVPKKWHPYVKRGVEAWLPALEQAGFKNAIVCKVAPSIEEDPDWDAEDARYTVIRWNATSMENAFGLQMVDPRTGEVVAGQVVFYHNFLGFLENQYFIQASPLDPSARKLPFAQPLMGKLVQYVMTHEVGHVLGLEHNMKASSMYTIASLRNPASVAKNDIASSIMDYARFDYVAQPGDGVPLDRHIGQYDKFAIEWGYKPVLGAKTPDGERATLNKIAARQNSNAFLRFGNYLHPEDPFSIGEDLSNDPVEASRLGILNLRRAAALLIPATVRPGEDYNQLNYTYGAMVFHHAQLLNNAFRLVAGVKAEDHEMMNGKPVYTPISADVQRAAVRFVCGPGAKPPRELLSPEITRRLFAKGDVERMVSYQIALVQALFADARIARMVDQEAALGKRAYSVAQMLTDVQSAVWSELAMARPVIDVYRRQYQRGYLTALDGKLNGAAANRTDLMPLARASLQLLARQIDRTIPKAGDSMTALHLQESRRQIESILNGTSPASKLLPAPLPPARAAAIDRTSACFGGL